MIDRDSATKALKIYREIDDLQSSLSLTETFYGTAAVVVSNSSGKAGQVEIPQAQAAEIISAMIATRQTDLRSLGFEPE